MKTNQFKTNINCSGCVAKVAPFLNALLGENQWEVDTTNKNKILTVKSANVEDQKIIKEVEKAGFTIGYLPEEQ